MKNKKLVLVLAGLVALSSKAATYDWGSPEMHDSGPLDDGGGWALNGVQTYLYYGGVNGAETFSGVAWDPIAGALTIASGTNSGTFVDSYVTAGDDYDVNGAFNVTMGKAPDEPIGLTWLGDTSDSWEDMNLREFTIVTISSATGDLGDGTAMYNFYTGNAGGFSTATGPNSLGAMTAGAIDVSGMGPLPIPEPATFGLLGIAGLGMFLARKKTRR